MTIEQLSDALGVTTSGLTLWLERLSERGHVPRRILRDAKAGKATANDAALLERWRAERR